MSSIQFTYSYSQLTNCKGEDLKGELLDDLPTSVSKNFNRKKCCRVYEVAWNSRIMKEITCSSNTNDFVCQIELKMFAATLYKYCFEEALEIANQSLKKNNFTLKGIF